MNPRPVAFDGVARPNVYGDLERDLMREHAAVGQSFAGVSRQFVPRPLPKTVGTSTYSAASWDLVIVAGDGTIYLPKLGPEDAGDKIEVAVRSGATALLVADTGVVVNGTATIIGLSFQRVTWDGAEWWIG